MSDDLFDTQQVLNDVVEGVREILSEQNPKLRSFIRSQTRGAIEFGALITDGVAKGEITPAQQAAYLIQLEDMITAAAYTVAGSIIAIVEAIWNKMVDIIWSAINSVLTTVINTSLPLPVFGEDN
ncbi:hypothetical protein RJ45_12860 [Photobacterium gaetbulicola]|uniref:Uncharacterized protein n=1 Tax=Photobacterium gaetbulicola TaxID=1295392 RepID=A0A0B9H335_9GAMM|nr:hypothetical protein [Photobacterium gaetbulicola]KHT63287.1 hypothetical protein RJ45_12860 [Photobacterium gaetbulicola]